MYSTSRSWGWMLLFAGMTAALIVLTGSVKAQSEDEFVTWDEDAKSDTAGDGYVTWDEREGAGASSETFAPLDNTEAGRPPGG